jgi:hypothetical protein
VLSVRPYPDVFLLQIRMPEGNLKHVSMTEGERVIWHHPNGVIFILAHAKLGIRQTELPFASRVGTLSSVAESNDAVNTCQCAGTLCLTMAWCSVL